MEKINTYNIEDLNFINKKYDKILNNKLKNCIDSRQQLEAISKYLSDLISNVERNKKNTTKNPNNILNKGILSAYEKTSTCSLIPVAVLTITEVVGGIRVRKIMPKIIFENVKHNLLRDVFSPVSQSPTERPENTKPKPTQIQILIKSDSG